MLSIQPQTKDSLQGAKTVMYRRDLKPRQRCVGNVTHLVGGFKRNTSFCELGWSVLGTSAGDQGKESG